MSKNPQPQWLERLHKMNITWTKVIYPKSTQKVHKHLELLSKETLNEIDLGNFDIEYISQNMYAKYNAPI